MSVAIGLPTMTPRPLELFVAYADEDASHVAELSKHLSGLEHRGMVSCWHRGRLAGGEEWESKSDAHLMAADIVLLALSPDFFDSRRCQIEMKEAVSLHERGLAHIIPVIVRPVEWRSMSLGRFQPLPGDGVAVTASPNLDSAWMSVVQGVQRVAEGKLRGANAHPGPDRTSRPPPPVALPERRPASSSPTHYLRAWKWAGLSLVVAAIVVVALMANRPDWRLARDGVDYLQLLVLLCVSVSVWRTTPLLPPRSGGDGDWRSFAREFAVYWRLLWTVWLLHYAIHSLRHGLEQVIWGSEVPSWEWSVGTIWLLHFLHMVQGTMLLIMSWTLVRPTLPPLERSWSWHHVPAWTACCLFAMADGVVLIASRSAQGGPSVVQASVLVPALICGIFAAACLGILVGRLGSVSLDVHTVELVAFYAYAGFQSLFQLAILAEFGKDLRDVAHVVELVLKAFALALKLGLYSVVQRQITGGRLAFHMQRVATLDADTRRQWAEFEERCPKPT